MLVTEVPHTSCRALRRKARWTPDRKDRARACYCCAQALRFGAAEYRSTPHGDIEDCRYYGPFRPCERTCGCSERCRI